MNNQRKQVEISQMPTVAMPAMPRRHHPGAVPQGTPRRWFDLFTEQGYLYLVGSLLGLVLLLGGGILLWAKLCLSPAVKVYQIGQARDVDLFIGGGGIIFPQQQLTVTYPATERIVSVKVAPGDHVHANQPLLQLDPTQLNVSVKQAADDMAAAQNYLNSVSGIGNAVTVAQAQQDYEQAKSRYEALSSRVSSATLQDGNLVSPIDGVVTAVNVNPGSIFADNTPLLTIMDLSSVIVHVKVPLVYLGQVKMHQTAQVMPSAASHTSFSGKVTGVIPQADPQTDTFEVWISINNGGNQLLPGMSAFARIQSPVHSLAVPRLAVLSPDGDAHVFVVRQQVAHLERVQVVGRMQDMIYVSGPNIAASEQVVLVGLDMLQDGQHVRVTDIEGPKS
ncbi:MAG: efflux RND transporter periplasmic adaptor subunit [Ktedonobacteraceae bacterium]|nr:efflux RND transporter periplasmic adaptor subunit [Ktedonobacteraceae bacterium]MBO0790271.1 efflux RND transporter periplasmic adaptor subunit [Ktedonobacteraceae bacterium]